MTIGLRNTSAADASISLLSAVCVLRLRLRDTATTTPGHRTPPRVEWTAQVRCRSPAASPAAPANPSPPDDPINQVDQVAGRSGRTGRTGNLIRYTTSSRALHAHQLCCLIYMYIACLRDHSEVHTGPRKARTDTPPSNVLVLTTPKKTRVCGADDP